MYRVFRTTNSRVPGTRPGPPAPGWSAAALPLLDFNGAVLTKASAGRDVSSQRIIR